MKSRWYKDAVVYQIYPRSFCDSNGDGIGDIPGIISKLDYIKSLGVTAVWLSPVYKSPNDDNGYDISNYREIMDEFGTLDDFKQMLQGMHDRGIKLIMDLVVNHTSDEHYWFEESRKSKDNPYRDYYIWRKGRGKDGKKPPNNWTSRFTGSAWAYDELTDEWYLHLFSKKQPDLNWDNPKVRQEVIDICNFWLDMGVDGFRCDVISLISKREGLPMGKFNPVMCGDEHFVAGPHIHEYLNEVYEKSWSKYDTMILGEAYGITCDKAEPFIKESRGEMDTIITFEIMEVDMKWSFLPVKLNLVKLKQAFEFWQKLPNDCWNTLYLENHDQPRSVGRYGKLGEYQDKLGKMLAIMLHMQKGTSYIYQGQEIGMTNCPYEIDEYTDIMATQIFSLVGKYFKPALGFMKKCMDKRARDHARTPMQWNDDKYCGFSTVQPWSKVNPNKDTINVDSQEKDNDSLLNFYRKVVAYRLHNDLVIKGEFNQFYKNSKKLFVYERKINDRLLMVICNFTDKNVEFVAPKEYLSYKCSLKLNNYDDASNSYKDMTLRPYEALVYELSKA